MVWYLWYSIEAPLDFQILLNKDGSIDVYSFEELCLYKKFGFLYMQSEKILIDVQL